MCFSLTVLTVRSRHDPAYVQGGVKAIVGSYTGGRLEGQAKMVMADGTCRHCWMQRGWLHGPCRWAADKLDPLYDGCPTISTL